MVQQALCRYSGVNVATDWRMTLGWGITPSVCTLETTRSISDLRKYGTLTISQGNGGVRFPNSHLADVSVASAATGIFSLTIEDRRWAWRFGYIDGDYNRYTHESGKLIREKSPRELATLLLKAMGESGFDVSKLPNEARPRVSWQADNPAQELLSLCTDLSTAIVLNPFTNRVELYPYGQGTHPRIRGGKIYEQNSISATPVPDQIRVVSGPILWQTNMKFDEAVGYDIDGEIKPIDQLSYYPLNGWSKTYPSAFGNIEGEYRTGGNTVYLRDLAIASVWKMYRCTGQTTKYDGDWSPKALADSDKAPQSLDDLLPFLNTRLEKDPTTGYRLPLEVRGLFRKNGFGYENGPDGSLFEGSAQVMQESGILRFSEPLLSVRDGSTKKEIFHEPAQLTADVAYVVSSEGVKVRGERWLDNSYSKAKSLARFERHPEIAPEIIEKLNQDNSFSYSGNLDQVEKQLNHYLNAIAAEYRSEQGKTIQWPGLKKVYPNGLIRQVVWEGGTKEPLTTIGINSNANPYSPKWEDTQEYRDYRTKKDLERLSQPDPIVTYGDR